MYIIFSVIFLPQKYKSNMKNLKILYTVLRIIIVSK